MNATNVTELTTEILSLLDAFVETTPGGLSAVVGDLSVSGTVRLRETVAEIYDGVRDYATRIPRQIYASAGNEAEDDLGESSLSVPS